MADPSATIVPGALRVRGSLQASFVRVGSRTKHLTTHEAGGLRLLLPRGQHGCEAVAVNTGGGVAGGDRWALAFDAQPGACVTLTTPSAERVYRAQGEAASVVTGLTAASGASLFWLPQETILFDGARLQRRIEAAAASDATLVLAETTVFGRAAMGEEIGTGSLRDRWRVRRDDVLVFAEDVRLEGEIAATLDLAASGGGARALATVLMLAPDAETYLEGTRAILAASALGTAPITSGASAWNGLLLVRAAAARPSAIRHVLSGLLPLLCSRPLPRVWQ